MDEARARQLLDDERERLIGQRTDIEADGVLDGGDPQDQEEAAAGQHPGDIGTETHDRSLDLGLLEQIEAELSAVDDALRRLDDGTYGRCETCGQPIPDERLEAEPTARFDVMHQQAIDDRGRIPGEHPQRT